MQKSGKPVDQSLIKLERQVTSSRERVEQRRLQVPVIEYPENLPISAKRELIADTIAQHQVVVLAGETGSGKTTQIPKICLDLGRGVKGMIGHTQPRRIAARTVASRIAEELMSPLGESVGYQVRFTDHSTENTHIKLMTDGILLAEIQRDRFLSGYDTLIIDEAHERSLNIDFLLGYIKTILPKRPDLKVIITSATIDLERFSQHFDNAPIIEVSGRTYPVEVLYRPMVDDQEDLYQAITSAIDELLQQEQGQRQRGGDILVFLSGEREIREAALAIRKAQFPHLEVLPLYARLSLAEQNRVFASHRGRRVVLATNVAETSITVPGIRYVIDPGYARISRYSYRTKVQRLPVEPISQASANQRKGRCGRVSEGVCVRLYDEEDFNNRLEFTDAEILRTNLAAVILQMLQLRIGNIRHFPFVDAPDHRLINDGFKLLAELQAVDREGRLNKVGQQLVKLPLDPQLARMLLSAQHHNCVRELLIIASALSVQDPRERPAEKRQAADEKHRRFWDENSDFLAYINLWQYCEEQRQELSQNQLRKLCKREFLSYLRLREWRDIHHQLRLAARDLGFRENPEPAGYEVVHRALLSGLLGNLGFRGEEREYQGARNRKFYIFPGSSQFKKKPKWILAGELLETAKLYGHTVAKIEPAWALAAAEHLVKRHYFEPHYDRRAGQVMAYEKVSLYGLVLVEKQRVNYSRIDVKVAREVFIRSALVEGQYFHRPKSGTKTPRQPPAFFAHNQGLLQELEALEAKSRRRDILADEEVLYAFYDERIPADIVNRAGFEHWRKQAEQKDPQLLFIDRAHLMQHDASGITEAQFPNELDLNGLVLPLSYHFEPGNPDDGVSLHVPVSVLHQLPEQRLEWLVPGMLREKCIALVKGLPKQWRKHFVPVPAFVDKALPAMKVENVPLTEALGFQLKRHTALDIPRSAWPIEGLDDYYRLNIKVLDEAGKCMASGRDLGLLRERYRDQLQQTLQSAGSDLERDGIVAWDFGELPETAQLKRAGVSIRACPALMDETGSVALKLLDNPKEALWFSRRGVARLLLLSSPQQAKYLKKEILKGKDMGLSVAGIGNREEVADDIAMAAFAHVCLSGEQLPRDQQAFDACLEAGREQLIACANEIEGLLLSILSAVVEIKKRLKTQKNALALAFAVGDINSQLKRLIFPGFLYATPLAWLRQYPRYLKAVLVRLEKAPQQIQKDKVMIAELAGFWEQYDDFLNKEGDAAAQGNSALIEFRWMLEEFRISLFAQSLKTLMPVSAKRLRKQWAEVVK